MSETITTPSVETRLHALTTVHEQMPHLDDNAAMRVAEWMLTGSTLLDPARTNRAARELARGLGRDHAVPSVAAEMRGLAQQVLVAYHSDDA